MRKNLFKIAAAGFGLVMASTFFGCAESDKAGEGVKIPDGGKLPIVCPDGTQWDETLNACKAPPSSTGTCPDGTTLSADGTYCVGSVISDGTSSQSGGTSSPSGNSSSSGGTSNPSGNSSSSVGDDGTITVGAWTYKAEGDETSKTTVLSTMSISESAGVITGTGTVRIGTASEDYGFAQIVAWPNTDAEMAKFKAANSISFTAKGDGKTYYVEAVMSNIEDGASHRKTFTASSAGNTVTVCFNKLAQADWGNKVPFDASKLINVTWQPHSDNLIGNFSFSISNVSVGNDPSCNGSTAGGTLIDTYWYNYADSKDIDEKTGAPVGTSTINDIPEGIFSSITISGNLKEGGYLGLATDNPDVLALIKNSTSVSFKIKGDGKTYRMNFQTTDVTNYDWHQTTFTTTNDTEKEVTINFSALTQQLWDNTIPAVSFNKNNITAISFTPVSSGAFGPTTISELRFK